MSFPYLNQSCLFLTFQSPFSGITLALIQIKSFHVYIFCSFNLFVCFFFFLVICVSFLFDCMLFLYLCFLYFAFFTISANFNCWCFFTFLPLAYMTRNGSLTHHPPTQIFILYPIIFKCCEHPKAGQNTFMVKTYESYIYDTFNTE